MISRMTTEYQAAFDSLGGWAAAPFLDPVN
jgi:hypothetical protein